jgi:hypothetical protein
VYESKKRKQKGFVLKLSSHSIKVRVLPSCSKKVMSNADGSNCTARVALAGCGTGGTDVQGVYVSQNGQNIAFKNQKSC